MSDGSQRWQLAANIFTVIASVAATAAFIASFVFFERTMDAQSAANDRAMDAQSDANAVHIMNEHIKLFVENRELHNCPYVMRSEPAPATPPSLKSAEELPSPGQCIDAAEHAAFTAEIIFDLEGDDPAWKETVYGMIRENRWWYASREFRPSRYDKKFVAKVREIIPNANTE